MAIPQWKLDLLKDLAGWCNLDKGAAAAGDVAYGGQDIDFVSAGSLARVAGVSIHTISGVDLDATNYLYMNTGGDRWPRVVDADWTYSFWFKLDTKTTHRSLIGGSTNASQRTIDLKYSSVVDKMQMTLYDSSVNNNPVTITSPLRPIVTGVWYHCIASFDKDGGPVGSGQLHLRISSSASGTIAPDSTKNWDKGRRMRPLQSSDTLYIGRENNLGYMADGKFDSLIKWDRLLTEDEQAKLFNSGSGLQWPLFTKSDITTGLDSQPGQNRPFSIGGGDTGGGQSWPFSLPAKRGNVSTSRGGGVVVEGQLANRRAAFYNFEEIVGNRVSAGISGMGLYDVNTVGGVVGVMGSGAKFIKGSYEKLYVAQGDHNAFSPRNLPYAVCFWAKMPASPVGNNVMAQKYYTTGNQREFNIQYQTSDSKLHFKYSAAGSADSADISCAFSTNAWHHVAAIFDPAALQMRLYVDCVLLASGAYTSVYNGTAPFCIGGVYNVNSADDMTGYIDSMGVWSNRLLTLQDIQWLYNGGSGRQAPFPLEASGAPGPVGVGSHLFLFW